MPVDGDDDEGAAGRRHRGNSAACREGEGRHAALRSSGSPTCVVGSVGAGHDVRRHAGGEAGRVLRGGEPLPSQPPVPLVPEVPDGPELLTVPLMIVGVVGKHDGIGCAVVPMARRTCPLDSWRAARKPW